MRGYTHKIFSCWTVLLLALTAHCQPPQKIGSNYQFKSVGADSGGIRLPKSSLPPTPNLNYVDSGAVAYRKLDSSVWVWTGKQWIPVTAKGRQGLSDSGGYVLLGQDTSNHALLNSLQNERAIIANTYGINIVDSMTANLNSSLRLMGDTFFIMSFPKRGVQEIGGVTPPNFGQTYASGHAPGGIMRPGRWTYGYAQESSADAMPDNVYQVWAYNEDGQGNRVDVTEAGARMAFETNFLNVLGSLDLTFELHIFEMVLFNGTRFRPESFYANKRTGFVLDQKFIENEEWHSFTTPTSDGDLYAQITSSSEGQGPFGELFLHGGRKDLGLHDGIIWFSDRDFGVQHEIQSIFGRLLIGIPGNREQMLALEANGDIRMNFSESLDPTTWHQTVIGMDTTDVIEPTAQLQVISDRKGFLPPRLTTTQKLAIVSPAEGLLVYDKTLHQMSYYNGTLWVNF